MKTVKVGQRVYWNDPDDGFSSGNGKVVALQYEPVDSHTVISLEMDDGGTPEVLLCELSRERKKK
jgi:hypothetical protein